jgi:alpha-glucoside transport system permease protein
MSPGRAPRRRPLLLFVALLAPALLLLGALVAYPILFTLARSLFDRTGGQFVGLANYREIVERPATLAALRNNLVWAVLAPSLTTALGCLLAVVTERIRWQTAFRLILFLPMAISLLAAGVMWRLVYEQDPGRGLANALLRAAVSVVEPPGPYPGARASQPEQLAPEGHGFRSARTYAPGETAAFGLVAIPPRLVSEHARPARPAMPAPGVIRGVVWLDFTRGGRGERGRMDAEVGLPGVRVAALAGGRAVAEAVTGADGSFELATIPAGGVHLTLAEASFRPPFAGLAWLGRDLVTPAIILSYVWMWTGFAVMVIAAGLAAIPREALEAARVDGAGEWRVLRHVTLPLLAPALGVVFVTLLINVLKIFDLVLVIAPGSVQADATVIALEVWRAAFGARDHGLGSALAVVLFLLVLPPVLLNLRRLRSRV